MNNIKITDVRYNPGDSAFLIDDGKTSILYDSGFAFTGCNVADNIKDVLKDRRLDYIFLTHSHYDHVLGSVYALKYYPDAKVVAGEYAAKIFSKPSAKALMRELDNKYAKTCNAEAYEDLIDNLRVDIAVSDGDVIKAGNMEFIALNLPGHTKCSVGYYLPENKLLLGCETIGVYDGEGGVVPSYLVGYEMTINSIKRAEKLDIENILVPHYGLLSKSETQIYLKKAKAQAVDTANDIADKLRRGIPKEEISKAFIDSIYHGYIKKIYPMDAALLNTGIMINLLERELL